MVRVVPIDADGTCHAYLGVVVSHPTGVVYRQQCGGVECLERSLEGYFVLLGGASFDMEQGRLRSEGLTAPFHQRGCRYGGSPHDGTPQLPPDRLAALRRLVEAIPYWTPSKRGDDDVRGHLRLDEDRVLELVEAWVPVITPDGPGVLTWPNRD